MQTLTSPRSFAAILVAVLALFSPGALAQQSQNPAQECIEHVQSVTQRTVYLMRQIADRRSEALQELDANGADDAQLRHVAQEGRENIAQRAQIGADRVQSLVERCVQHLVDNCAPYPVIMGVISAGQEARQRIGVGAQNNIDRINRALFVALNN